LEDEMSKERALLNLCAVTLKARNICPLLLKDISELLAQPEQEPVAWQLVANFITDGDILQYTYSKPRDELYEYYRVTPLYTSPPKREPLSTDTMLKLITEHRDFPLNLVRAIEKAHGIGVDDE